MANVPRRAPLGTLSFNRDDDHHTVASTSFASPASKFAGRSTASLDDDGDAYAVASVNTPEMCAMADGCVGSSHEIALSLVVERDRAIERSSERRRRSSTLSAINIISVYRLLLIISVYRLSQCYSINHT